MAVSKPDSIQPNSPYVTYGAGVWGWPQNGSNIVFPDMPSGLDYFGPALRIAESLPILPLTLSVTVPIPEPLTLALMVIGMAGIGVSRRQRS
jgi:hypothetical protein